MTDVDKDRLKWSASSLFSGMCIFLPFAAGLLIPRSDVGGSDTVRVILHKRNLTRSSEMITDRLDTS
jgi:hypothetical protein